MAAHLLDGPLKARRQLRDLPPPRLCHGLRLRQATKRHSPIPSQKPVYDMDCKARLATPELFAAQSSKALATAGQLAQTRTHLGRQLLERLRHVALLQAPQLLNGLRHGGGMPSGGRTWP